VTLEDRAHAEPRGSALPVDACQTAARRPEYDALLSVTDLLIDGPFERARLDLSRPWLGSRNQRYHFLTEHYRSIAASIESIPNRLEVRVGQDGRILMNGLGDVSTMRALLRRLV
jgi:anaerobic ribonucleoside-triphosphate reductase activating protein